MQLFGAKPKPAPAAPASDETVKEGSLQTFAQDVIQASQSVPVLVDFWAPWCGPCKQLTPLLERLVRAAKGKVRLVKINIDENPEIAQQLRIQSVPTVYAFVQGQPVTGFAGAQPESQIKALIEQLTGEGGLGGDVAGNLEAAKAALDAGNAEGAAVLYSQVLGEEPENAEAIGGLARCLVAQGETEAAREVLDGVPAHLATSAPVSGAKAALALAAEAGSPAETAGLEARLKVDPDDHDARLRLATQMFLRGRVEEAFSNLLHIVKADREWNEGAARREMVKLFDALGPTHPQTLKGRRMLSSVLFS